MKSFSSGSERESSLLTEFTEALKNAFFDDQESILFTNHHINNRFIADVVMLSKQHGVAIFELKTYRMSTISEISSRNWKLSDPPISVMAPHYQLRQYIYSLREQLEDYQLNYCGFVVLPKIQSAEWPDTASQTNTIFQDDYEPEKLHRIVSEGFVGTGYKSSAIPNKHWAELKESFSSIYFDNAMSATSVPITGEFYEPQTHSKKVFVCYRRDDSAMASGRITDHLRNEFGDTNVFQDVQSIQPGENFKKVIDQSISSCRVLLVVIGPKWATIVDSTGQKRLFNKNDFVYLEVSIGLQRQAEGSVTLIPVLVEGAQMPAESMLPDQIQELSFIQAIKVDTDRFQTDIQSLITHVKGLIGK